MPVECIRRSSACAAVVSDDGADENLLVMHDQSKQQHAQRDEVCLGAKCSTSSGVDHLDELLDACHCLGPLLKVVENMSGCSFLLPSEGSSRQILTRNDRSSRKQTRCT